MRHGRTRLPAPSGAPGRGGHRLSLQRPQVGARTLGLPAPAAGAEHRPPHRGLRRTGPAAAGRAVPRRLLRGVLRHRRGPAPQRRMARGAGAPPRRPHPGPAATPRTPAAAHPAERGAAASRPDPAQEGAQLRRARHRPRRAGPPRLHQLQARDPRLQQRLPAPQRVPAPGLALAVDRRSQLRPRAVRPRRRPGLPARQPGAHPAVRRGDGAVSLSSRSLSSQCGIESHMTQRLEWSHCLFSRLPCPAV
ncbi:hypothetical protein OF001_U80075 [Pseudomonas sp. OF001]|nr:hypothetical protein OF001_U80075 [Pseudomonas sp. OF001]